MGKSLNISFDIDRTTLLSVGLSAAAHIAAICGLASVVVTPMQPHGANWANSRLAMDIPLTALESASRPLPPPATEQDLEKLLAKVPVVPPKVEEPEEPEVRLGSDDGTADTRTWLGFAEATEHHAQKSVVEQSAVTQDSGNPGEQATPQQPQLEPKLANEQAAPSGSAEPDTQERLAVEGAGKGDRGGGKDAVDRPQRTSQDLVQAQKAAAGVRAQISTLTGIFAELVRAGASGIDGKDAANRDAKEKVEASLQARAGTRAEDAHSATKSGANTVENSPAAKPEVSPTSGGDSKSPGIIDDREAEATSLKEPVDLIVNGKVQSAKGLRIRTVQAEWATTTLLTARPRNPQVVITFNRTGKVVRAAFAPGRSTGSEDVDQPLLNSIYRWTAKGDTLLKLTGAGTRGELTITVNILFP